MAKKITWKFRFFRLCLNNFATLWSKFFSEYFFLDSEAYTKLSHLFFYLIGSAFVCSAFGTAHPNHMIWIRDSRAKTGWQQDLDGGPWIPDMNHIESLDSRLFKSFIKLRHQLNDKNCIGKFLRRQNPFSCKNYIETFFAISVFEFQFHARFQ